MSNFLMMIKGQHKPELLSLEKTIICSISHETATITMPSLQFRTIREEGVFSSVIESIVFTIKKICSGSCQSRNLSLNLAKNTRLINLNDCNNPANINIKE